MKAALAAWCGFITILNFPYIALAIWKLNKYTGLNKSLAGWRMDAEQEGTETGKKDSTRKGGE